MGVIVSSAEHRMSWTAAGRAALVPWLAVRVVLIAFVLGVSYLLALRRGTGVPDLGPWVLDRFVWWDSDHFLRIAQDGYLPHGATCCEQAFFPGYPLSIRLVAPLVAGSAAIAGLVVSQLAAAAAAVLIWRIGSATSGDPRVGSTAVLLLSLAPFGIFFSAVYSEALFLALVLAAWWCGTRRHWWSAGLWAAAASSVRINGLFLVAALAVMYLDQLRADGRRRPRWDALSLAAGPAVVGAYFGYLYLRTGSWNSWLEAEANGWQRHTAMPWQGLIGGLNAVRDAGSPDLMVSPVAELITVVAGLALLVVLVVRRHWPEATYLGLSLAVVICSTTLVSAPRYALTWFPAYLMLARLSVHRGGRWVRPVALVLGPVLLAVISLRFSGHRWVA